MTGYGFDFETVAEIAEALGIRAEGRDLTPGRGGVERCTFTLKLDTTKPLGARPFQRVSRSTVNGNRPRRVSAVCFHGHREVMREVFRRFPDARIKSALATYRGRDDFEASYPATGSTGNAAASPYGFFTSYADACECDDATRNAYPIEFGTLDADLRRVVNRRTISSASILACPHVLLVPEHYRDDGSCRCDDEAEQARLIRECGYTAADFEPVEAA